MQLTSGKSCALIIGGVARNPGEFGHRAQNVVEVLENGKRVFRQAKTLLPTYDVFDEARYFEPAQSIGVWNCDGVSVALGICEDLWGQDPVLGRRLYGRDPVLEYKKLGARLVFSLSASPFELGKRIRRENLHRDCARSRCRWFM